MGERYSILIYLNYITNIPHVYKLYLSKAVRKDNGIEFLRAKLEISLQIKKVH